MPYFGPNHLKVIWSLKCLNYSVYFYCMYFFLLSYRSLLVVCPVPVHFGVCSCSTGVTQTEQCVLFQPSITTLTQLKSAYILPFFFSCNPPAMNKSVRVSVVLFCSQASSQYVAETLVCPECMLCIWLLCITAFVLSQASHLSSSACMTLPLSVLRNSFSKTVP